MALAVLKKSDLKYWRSEHLPLTAAKLFNPAGDVVVTTPGA
jgi:hypothetical protein